MSKKPTKTINDYQNNTNSMLPFIDGTLTMAQTRCQVLYHI